MTMMMSSPYDTGRLAEFTDLTEVHSHTDVARVVEQMLSDLMANPGDWQNATLPEFLAALAANLDSLGRLHANLGRSRPAQPTWQLFAETLVKATGDE